MDRTAFDKQLAALRAHRAATPMDMRAVFAADSGRFARFSATDGDMLLDFSRGPNAEHFDRAIDVQMSRLRKKLARPGSEDLIRTIRNEGYMFVAEVTAK